MAIRLLACLFLSGCTTTSIVSEYADKPYISVTERNIDYSARISHERGEILITTDLWPSVWDIGQAYLERTEISEPLARTDLARYKKNGAKRAAKIVLADNDCTLNKNGDGSSVFFVLNTANTIYAGDVTCSTKGE